MTGVPRAVLREQDVSAKPLEQALLRFAEHVRDHGFSTDGPFAAASDLLLRRQPRRAPLVEPHCSSRRNPYWLH